MLFLLELGRSALMQKTKPKNSRPLVALKNDNLTNVAFLQCEGGTVKVARRSLVNMSDCSLSRSPLSLF